MSVSFVSLLRDRLSQNSNRPAFIIRSVEYSYAQLNTLIQERIVHIQASLSDEPAIGLYCYDDIETYAFLLACLMTGKAYVPLHPSHPKDRNDRIQALAKLGYIYSPGNELTAVSTEQFHSDNSLAVDNTSAYILFTSGSTGIPKGVPITHRNLNTFIEACQRASIVAREEDRFLQMFDLTFDLSVFSFLYPLCHGACVCTVPTDEVKHFGVYRILEEQNISVALMVPSVMEMLKPYFSDLELPALQQLLFCGEALRAETMQALIPYLPNTEIRNVYGPTEATIFCTSYILHKHPDKWLSKNGILSIGEPLWNTRLQISSEEELLISGAQVTTGYVNDSDKNKQSFVSESGQNWYKSGDLAIQDASGNYLYIGRKDQQVKIQGYRIEPGEIEFQLNQILQTRRGLICACIKDQVSELHAVIEGAPEDTEGWKSALRKKLPGYMQPVCWHFIPEFPLNVNGKTDRKFITEKIYAE